MFKKVDRKSARQKRHYRLRNRLKGTPERPRLSVYRSVNHIYAQIIDDIAGKTLVAASTLEKDTSNGLGNTSNIDAAKAVGKSIAAKAISKGIKAVVFDRGGNIYHGRVAALADAAREAGLDL